MPHKELEKRNEYSRNYTKKHPERFKGREEYQKEYRLKNKERIRWQRIEKRYGITEEQWKQIFNDQGGKCCLCQRTEKQIKKSKSKYFVVDHNHETGEIRGLLCGFCNRTVLAVIGECPNFAMRLHTYLSRKTNYGNVNGSC